VKVSEGVFLTIYDTLILLYGNKTQKLEALKAQIYFRQHVLSQEPGDKKLFLKSVGVEQMTINVKKLIDDAGSRPSNSDRHILVGKQVRHRLATEEEGMNYLKWFDGKVCSQVYIFITHYLIETHFDTSSYCDI